MTTPALASCLFSLNFLPCFLAFLYFCLTPPSATSRSRDSCSAPEIPGEALLNVGILHVILEPFGAATPVLDIAPPNTVSAAAADSGAEAAAARPYVHLKCVTQVSKTGICGDYVRTSFNPLRAE
jgi:hypothetical protein